MTAHLQPLDDFDANEASRTLRELVDFVGYRPRALLTMARRPGLLPVVLGLVQAGVRGPGRLDPALRFLVATEASRSARCFYSAAHTAHAAVHLGVPVERLALLDRFETSDAFSAAEREALSLARLGGSPTGADDAAAAEQVFARVRQHYDEDELIELVTIVSTFGWFNRWNRLVRSELEDEPATLVARLPWLSALRIPAHGR